MGIIADSWLCNQHSCDGLLSSPKNAQIFSACLFCRCERVASKCARRNWRRKYLNRKKRARTTRLRDKPAEVAIEITDRGLRIPSDAVASIHRAGLLGEEYVSIDIRNSSAGPVANNGVLQTIESPQVDADQAIQGLQGFLHAVQYANTQKPSESPNRPGRTQHSGNAAGK